MSIFKSKKSLGAIAGTTVAGIALATAVYAAGTFGPSRPTFTWDNPADHITFNSITDNPTYGDERQLIKSRDVNSPTTDYATQTKVTDNEEVVLAVYFHNNAASNLNLVAKNTNVKFELPTNTASSLSAKGYITSSNATPSQVYATTELTSSQPFSISYEPGTAKLYTNYVSGVAISDDVVKNGALIGTKGTDGQVPGCGQFSGYVTVRVRVHVPTTPPVTPPVTPPTAPPTAPTPSTPVVQGKSTSLPNTGPGDVAAVFAGASALGTAGSYAVAVRRSRRQ